jgi:hypothetical protein
MSESRQRRVHVLFRNVPAEKGRAWHREDREEEQSTGSLDLLSGLQLQMESPWASHGLNKISEWTGVLVLYVFRNIGSILNVCQCIKSHIQKSDRRRIIVPGQQRQKSL